MVVVMWGNGGNGRRGGQLRWHRWEGCRGSRLDPLRRGHWPTLVRKLLWARPRVSPLKETALIAKLNMDVTLASGSNAVMRSKTHDFAWVQARPPPGRRLRRAAIEAPPSYPIAQLRRRVVCVDNLRGLSGQRRRRDEDIPRVGSRRLVGYGRSLRRRRRRGRGRRSVELKGRRVVVGVSVRRMHAGMVGIARP